ncbi:cupin domain-containing protein [Mycolicibacterium litorale]|uniref:cupin domain-containing protein n=1 Tax=Mycolicibacterium litorale TaxID=758802 RepID=UPI003CEDAED2
MVRFDEASVADVETFVLPPADSPAHISVFGPGTMALGHLAGPEGPGGISLWTAENTGFDATSLPEPEAAFVLAGVLRLTPTGGEPVDVTAGQGYYLPIGWSGRVEAVEPVRKIYIAL